MKMERGYQFQMKFSLRLALLYLVALSLPSLGDSACRLDLNAYPYRPLGGCTNVQESLAKWNIFPQTTCCQEALLVYAHALALEAKNASSAIFISQDQWMDCSDEPFQLQRNVSIPSCGFDSFYYGSGVCTSLKLSDIPQNVTDLCSGFGSSSFDDACGACSGGLSTALDPMLKSLNVEGNDSERGACLVGLIVSVIARRKNHSSDDFERCLPVLARPAPENYIKITDGVAEAVLAVILVMIGLTAIITLIKYVTKTKSKVKKPPSDQMMKEWVDIPGLYRFSKAEIDNALNYGKEKWCLGRGSAGLVYKAMLPSGQFVAVKQLYRSNNSDTFGREIDGLSRVRHPNLVCLFGCCIEGGEQYLVYEYCPEGNLAHHLLRKDTVLTWKDRVKILRDCALALKYLHTHTSGCIVHRDIKLTNILLTHDMQPKLSDFGLARIVGMEESKVFTDVRGTIGYMDPEYMSNAKLTSASDIYSFGIVMLQLLSGQRVIELDLDARDQLTRKAKDVNSGKRPLTDFQDPKMKGDIVTVDFKSLLEIAVLCAASSSAGRPTIDLVVEDLQKAFDDTEFHMNAREKGSFAETPSRSPGIIHL